MSLGIELLSDASQLQERESVGRIVSNGMCDIIITNMYVNKPKDPNSKGLSLNLEFKRAEDFANKDANTQTIYSAIIYKKNDGTVNPMGQELMSKIAKVAGKTMTDINKTLPTQIKIGQNVETVDAIVTLSGAKITGKFRQEFGMYNNKVTDKVRLLTVFRTSDKASAAEIINHEAGKPVELGKQYSIEASKEVTPKYNDGLTPESVAEIRKSGSTGTPEPKANFLDDLSSDDITI